MQQSAVLDDFLFPEIHSFNVIKFRIDVSVTIYYDITKIPLPLAEVEMGKAKVVLAFYYRISRRNIK